MSEQASVTRARVSVVGTGVIGSGWVAHFLRNGFEVLAWDPSDAARRRLPGVVEEAWPSLQALGLAEHASRDHLRVMDTLGAAVESAEFIQESGPEQLAEKAALFTRISGESPHDAIIATSTSGLALSAIQQGCVNPARTVVGHPFNPVYLIPLVEIVAGASTGSETVQWAIDFYARSGMKPLHLHGEYPGFVANRLQEALWREALHMLAAGEATLEQIDAAIVDGPGLRWAMMGPAMTLALAGGDGGVARALDLYDGPGDEWTRLPSPPMTAELRQKILDGCEVITAGRSPEELRRWRDDALLKILRARD